jgi:hypothetical protein
MDFARKIVVGLIVGLLGIDSFFARTAAAEEGKPSAFRIRTDIYLDQTKAPIKGTLTLFSDGVFYDFEEADLGLITVVDPVRNRIILLNRQRQVKSTLPLQQIQLTVAQARTQADSKLTAVRDSSYVTERDGVSTAVVKNDFMEYKAKAQSVPQSDIATQYADFADWSARLNAVTQAKLPPYLRMDLNRLIAGHGTIPSEIQRRTYQDGRDVVITTRLIPAWRLSQDDHASIARCSAMIAEFREVPESEYWVHQTVAQASANVPMKK